MNVEHRQYYYFQKKGIKIKELKGRGKRDVFQNIRHCLRNPDLIPMPTAVLIIPRYGRLLAVAVERHDALSPWICSRVLVISRGNVTSKDNNNHYFSKIVFKTNKIIKIRLGNSFIYSAVHLYCNINNYFSMLQGKFDNRDLPLE